MPAPRPRHSCPLTAPPATAALGLKKASPLRNTGRDPGPSRGVYNPSSRASSIHGPCHPKLPAQNRSTRTYQEETAQPTGLKPRQPSDQVPVDPVGLFYRGNATPLSTRTHMYTHSVCTHPVV